MPLFRYEAVNAAGELVKESVEAPSQEAVVKQVQDQGLLLITVQEAGASALIGLNQPLFGKRYRVSQKELVILTEEMAKLLKAGLPLDRAFTILVGIADEGPVKQLLSRIQDQVRGGSSLADAMEAQRGVFSRFYLNMIRAGEAGGSLEVVMNRLADFMERSKALRESVTSAMIYPAILVGVAALSVIILLTFVIPQFQQLFADAGKTLPLATQIVIALGDAVRHYWWLGGGLAFLLVLFLRRQMSDPHARLRLDQWFLRIPLVGDLIAKVEMARFSRTLGTLLGNGVALLNALAIVKETMTNQVMSAALTPVADNLKAGQGLAEPLMETGLFPKLAVHMIRVGEETGQLQEMLLQVADTYDGEVQATVKRLLTLLEPALIIGLAAVIAGIIMSILVAILSLNDLAF
ncbi:MAG: type II secretion system F family protein [Gammaproteobacteria bacterium]|nr:type II secretion system F family protein [Gammaproteobacteria bacterium]MCP5423709.1 type II secretion system F family protein [Gammaproteobacteria bacterium]